MILVATHLNKSNIHGIGLFATKEILAGTVIYTPSQSLDLCISQAELDTKTTSEKQTIIHYGFFDKKEKKWHLAFDDIRYLNHSKKSNTRLDENGNIVAKRDIVANEELTQNYADFEDLRDCLKDVK